MLSLHYPGAKAEEKTAKLKALIKHFDASWVEIEEVMPLDRLRKGYDTLYRELEGKPSRYADFVAALEKGANTELNDELPEHSAPPAAVTGEVKPPLKDVLLADLANLTTMADCVSWGITVSNMKGLSAEEYIELNKALMARQHAIGKNGGNGNGNGGEPEPKQNEPDGGKTEQSPPPVKEPGGDLDERRLASAQGQNYHRIGNDAGGLSFSRGGFLLFPPRQ